MHSITLDTAANLLLLSSVVSIGLMVKRTSKSQLKSSSSVLSISDVTSSILTGLLVLFHKYYIDHDHEYDYRHNKLNNTRYFYETTVFKNGRNDHNENFTSVNEKCDYKSVILQYAMFLIPFVNAFVSLLSFSTNFYANAMKMNCRCCELSNTRGTVENSNKNEDKRTKSSTSLPDTRESKSDDKSPRVNGRKSKFFDGKYTNLAIMSQWIIPALFTSIFQLGEYRTVDVSKDYTQDLICSITANFPFENCIETVDTKTAMLNVDSIGNDNMNSEDNLLWPHPNSSEVHDLVSKIQNIVQSAANDSTILNATQPTLHYNIAQLVDIMSRKNVTTMNDFIFADNDTELIEDFSRNFSLTKVARSLTKRQRESYMMHSPLAKVSNDNEQPELNNMLIVKCLKNRCMISTKFLKIYLFALLTLIYFAPIFVSALILMKSYYKCREITEKLENSKLKLESRIKNTEEIVDETYARQQQSNALQLGWFSENINVEEVGQEATVEETEQKQETETCSEFERIACELSCETEKMHSLFKIFKVNAMVAVVLWTPFFLQILSKVLFCSNVPNWLTETTFFATIIFSMFKNAVNVNVMKVEADTNTNKSNMVYPSKLNLP